MRTAAEIREERKCYTVDFKNGERDHESRNVCNLQKLGEKKKRILP